MAALDDQMQCI
jgi:hypothetical protein